MQSIEVTGLSDAEIAEDFSFSEVTLATRDGSSLRCRFQPKSLDMIVAQLAQISPHPQQHRVDGWLHDAASHPCLRRKLRPPQPKALTW